MAKKIYSFEEVEKHNKKEDCWIIVFGKVFNVTRFLEDHPGGRAMLLMATGKDATDEFDGLPHSSNAREKMKEFYIGDIDPSTFPKLINPNPNPTTDEEHQVYTAAAYFSSKILLPPLLVMAVAAVLVFFFNVP